MLGCIIEGVARYSQYKYVTVRQTFINGLVSQHDRPLCQFIVIDRINHVVPCVCGMAFLCDNILVKVPQLQAGTVAI